MDRKMMLHLAYQNMIEAAQSVQAAIYAEDDSDEQDELLEEAHDSVYEAKEMLVKASR